MSIRQSTYHSPTYKAYQSIEPDDWHNILRFYEEHQQEISHLAFGEHFDLLTVYANALFEVRKYKQFLNQAETILIRSIEHNIQYFKGEDIYQKMLFQKSVAHYYLLEYKQAEHTLRELCKINPTEKMHRLYLLKCLRKQRPSFVKSSRAALVLFSFLAALLIFIKILLVGPFQNKWVSFFEWGWIGLLSLGIIIFLTAELLHEVRVRKSIKSPDNRA